MAVEWVPRGYNEDGIDVSHSLTASVRIPPTSTFEHLDLVFMFEALYYAQENDLILAVEAWVENSVRM